MPHSFSIGGNERTTYTQELDNNYSSKPTKKPLRKVLEENSIHVAANNQIASGAKGGNFPGMEGGFNA